MLITEAEYMAAWIIEKSMTLGEVPIVAGQF
jgi:hypothetical protein